MGIPISDLRKKVSATTGGASAAQADHDALRRTRDRKVSEAANAGCFFMIARMSRLIEGFPDRVPPLAFILRDGVWRKDEGNGVYPRGQSAIIRTVLETMKIGDVEGAVETVRHVVGWNMATLGEDLVAAASCLPDHTVDALFHLGLEELAVVFDSELSAVPVGQIAHAAVRLGVDFIERSASPWSHLSRLADPASLPYLKALIKKGVKPDASTFVASASHHDLEVVDTLLDAGLSINSVAGARDETALHVAVLGATEAHSSEEAIEFARGLILRGISLDIRNKAGETACGLLGERIDRIYGNGDENRFDMMLVEELHGLLKRKALASSKS